MRVHSHHNHFLRLIPYFHNSPFLSFSAVGINLPELIPCVTQRQKRGDKAHDASADLFADYRETFVIQLPGVLVFLCSGVCITSLLLHVLPQPVFSSPFLLFSSHFSFFLCCFGLSSLPSSPPPSLSLSPVLQLFHSPFYSLTHTQCLLSSPSHPVISVHIKKFQLIANTDPRGVSRTVI